MNCLSCLWLENDYVLPLSLSVSLSLCLSVSLSLSLSLSLELKMSTSTLCALSRSPSAPGLMMPMSGGHGGDGLLQIASPQGQVLNPTPPPSTPTHGAP